MNKQEKEQLISFIDEAKEDLNFSFGICQKTYHGYVQGNKLINYIEHLYEQQKVKVPAFVAEYIIWCHSEGLTLWEVFKTIRGMPEKVWEWLKDEEHQAIFSKAYTDGYEVEEESKWIVKDARTAGMYFRGIAGISIEGQFSNSWSQRDGCIKFSNKEKAEAVATLTGGTVEKV